MTNPDLLEAAIAWHVQLPVLDGEGWQRFTAWLEADPAHARAYDVVSAEDTLRGPMLPANEAGAAPSRRLARWASGGGAIAAALVAMLMLHPFGGTPTAARYMVATGDAPRSIALADGTQITLAAGTRVELDRHDARYAALDRGAAVFRVQHDVAHPFEVHAAGHVFEDLGTVFELVRHGDALAVAVAEGGVLFDPGGAATKVTPGHRLAIDLADNSATLAPFPVARVGEWRTGQLRFSGAPLGDVVAALGQATGADVRLTGGLSARVFTGMVRVTGSASRDIPHFAELTGTSWKRDGDVWVIAPAERSAR